MYSKKLCVEFTWPNYGKWFHTIELSKYKGIYFFLLDCEVKPLQQIIFWQSGGFKMLKMSDSLKKIIISIWNTAKKEGSFASTRKNCTDTLTQCSSVSVWAYCHFATSHSLNHSRAYLKENLNIIRSTSIKWSLDGREVQLNVTNSMFFIYFMLCIFDFNLLFPSLLNWAWPDKHIRFIHPGSYFQQTECVFLQFKGKKERIYFKFLQHGEERWSFSGIIALIGNSVGVM